MSLDFSSKKMNDRKRTGHVVDKSTPDVVGGRTYWDLAWEHEQQRKLEIDEYIKRFAPTFAPNSRFLDLNHSLKRNICSVLLYPDQLRQNLIDSGVLRKCLLNAADAWERIERSHYRFAFANLFPRGTPRSLHDLRQAAADVEQATSIFPTSSLRTASFYAKLRRITASEILHQEFGSYQDEDLSVLIANIQHKDDQGSLEKSIAKERQRFLEDHPEPYAEAKKAAHEIGARSKREDENYRNVSQQQRAQREPEEADASLDAV